jgi:hypothetical protein
MNKTTYTKVFLQQLGKGTDDATVKEYLPLWWQNTRSKENSGLRLTDAGLEMIHDVGVKTYEIPYPKEMPVTTQVIIFLDKFIDCPYYITNKSITVTNEKKAVELALFSGDLRRYGITKTLSKTKQREE